MKQYNINYTKFMKGGVLFTTTLDTSKVAASSVDTSKVAASSVDTSKVAAPNVDTSNVDTSKVAAPSVAAPSVAAPDVIISLTADSVFSGQTIDINVNLELTDLLMCGSFSCIYSKVINGGYLRLSKKRNEIEKYKFQYALCNDVSDKRSLFIEKIYEFGRYSTKKLVDGSYQLYYEPIDFLNCLPSITDPNTICTPLENNGYYSIVEECTGGDLFSRIGTFEDINEIKIIIRNILSGLSFIHDKGFLYRDLKTENIVFKNADDISNIKLVDFGDIIFKDRSRISDIPFNKYTTPKEVYTSGHTEKSDIYSVGVILLQLVLEDNPLLEPPLSMEVREDTSALGKRSTDESAITLDDDTIHRDKLLSLGRQLRIRSPTQDIEDSSTILDYNENRIQKEEFKSTELRNLLTGLLDKNPERRFTIEDALRQEWFSGM